MYSMSGKVKAKAVQSLGCIEVAIIEMEGGSIFIVTSSRFNQLQTAKRCVVGDEISGSFKDFSQLTLCAIFEGCISLNTTKMA